jgi:NTP pyrophosphatase (non-canonical NTP hydrolase)
MQELMRRLKEFAEERDWDQLHSPKNLAMALSVEVAELVEHFQWLTEEQSYKLDSEKLEKITHEIGDIIIYLARFSDRLGIDPLEAAQNKIEINESKYPVRKVKGKSLKYTEY